MKILFYLPVITPWWFDSIVAPMLRALHGRAELHVIVAPLWRDTGIEMRSVEPLEDLTAINWHVVVPDDPQLFRLDGGSAEGLLDLVDAIAPDLTLARSADTDTPARFPGIVRYMMEPGAGPFGMPGGHIVLDERPFDYGVIPSGVEPLADFAAGALAAHWRRMRQRHALPDRRGLRQTLDLPEDRPVLAIPLQYEHPENFFIHGTPFEFGIELIHALLDHLDERIFLAISDHPLNRTYMLRTELDRVAAEHDDRIRLCRPADGQSQTGAMIRAADAVLVDKSKCISHAAFFGVPIVRLGASRMADWMNATPIETIDAGRIAHRGLPAPETEAARRWFGWHYGMRLVDPAAATPELLRARALGETSEAEILALIETLEPWLAGNGHPAGHSDELIRAVA